MAMLLTTLSILSSHLVLLSTSCTALSSSFHGQILQNDVLYTPSSRSTTLTMRKQKASDRRTRRLQRGEILEDELSSINSPGVIGSGTSPISPLEQASWKHKAPKIHKLSERQSGGRGRSRKRSQFYNTLSLYHNDFLGMITAEFRSEEQTVRQRIENAMDSPLSLEMDGHALFDMIPERRGNIFSDEVYRLTKAHDSTSPSNLLPTTSKFSQNDVIMLTLQPSGSGDFFTAKSMPTRDDATSMEARVLSTGPTYIDVAISSGMFEGTFGPAPNNVGPSGRGDGNMRLRADRYFSNVPYNRMVAALGQVTSLPKESKMKEKKVVLGMNSVDEVIRMAIISTYVANSELNNIISDSAMYDMNELAKKLAKPPLANSVTLANQVLGYLQSNPEGRFPPFNGPQISAIGAALSRRLTMIQGPPGTGKTTVAGAIAFGFAHQCRSLPGHNKVLATAFSNVGCDNLAEQLLKFGLKVVRIGKASATSQTLWDHTLDAAIARDPEAQKALEEAARATANLKLSNSRSGKKSGTGNQKIDAARSRNARDIATTAVKASIEACNIAATRALRDADVVVCTSIGAADPRLLAACGIITDEDELKEQNKRLGVRTGSSKRNQDADRQEFAPDGLPPLSLPYVLIDEACQSVEPATLIPIFSTNGCRSLVMMGDPCQLPPTVISDPTSSSPLAVSLMSRLAMSLPHPVIVTAQADRSEKDEYYLRCKATKQSVSYLRYKNDSTEIKTSYRKQYSGSLLLSIQYRMHPSISAFSSAVFYDGLLSTPSFLSKIREFPSSIEKVLPTEDVPVSVRFINIGGCNEKRGDGSRKPRSSSSSPSNRITENMSYSNEEEAVQLISLLKDTMSGKNGLGTPTFRGRSIGVITPYSAQVSLLKSLMASDADFRSLVRSSETSIEVNSVDAYQGRERDLIVFSAVRSNRRGNVGFLSDWRRMNVALTRARSGLIVIGDIETLMKDHHWGAFVKWCGGMNCVFDVDSVNECNVEDEEDMDIVDE